MNVYILYKHISFCIHQYNKRMQIFRCFDYRFIAPICNYHLSHTSLRSKSSLKSQYAPPYGQIMYSIIISDIFPRRISNTYYYHTKSSLQYSRLHNTNVYLFSYTHCIFYIIFYTQMIHIGITNR